ATYHELRKRGTSRAIIALEQNTEIGVGDVSCTTLPPSRLPRRARPGRRTSSSTSAGIRPSMTSAVARRSACRTSPTSTATAVPVRTVRAREVKVGMGGGGIFKPDWRMVAGMVKCPGWAFAFLQNTLPRFANIQPYAGPGAGLNDTIRFARKEMGGAFSWDEV